MQELQIEFVAPLQFLDIHSRALHAVQFAQTAFEDEYHEYEKQEVAWYCPAEQTVQFEQTVSMKLFEPTHRDVAYWTPCAHVLQTAHTVFRYRVQFTICL